MSRQIESLDALNLHCREIRQERDALKAELVEAQRNSERVAQLIAHRAVGNQEQDIQNGKIAGHCVVCQIPWPCSIATDKERDALKVERDRLMERIASLESEPIYGTLQRLIERERRLREALRSVLALPHHLREEGLSSECQCAVHREAQAALDEGE